MRPKSERADAPVPFLPYGRQAIDERDIQAVAEVLRSDWLTTGPKVPEFEAAVAAYVGAADGVAVSNGTTALHALLDAAGIGPGDEVIVPPMTFAATANAVLYVGARPVFADVDPETLLLDPEQAAVAVTPRTKAVLSVDYAGQPCDSSALRDLADDRGLQWFSDGAHALGAKDQGRLVGSLADATTFSFHPVKHITTGEGGLIATDDAVLAAAMRAFRNHGLTSDHRQRAQAGTWAYDMTTLGHNFRLSDLQCALGLSQLTKQPAWLARRQELAALYGDALQDVPGVTPLAVRPGVEHAYHLYVIRIDAAAFGMHRDAVFQALRDQGVGVNVHYRPVHLFSYYRDHLGTREGLCPHAEAAAEEILSLPMFPTMEDGDMDRVVGALKALQGGAA